MSVFHAKEYISLLNHYFPSDQQSIYHSVSYRSWIGNFNVSGSLDEICKLELLTYSLLHPHTCKNTFHDIPPLTASRVRDNIPLFKNILCGSSNLYG